MSADELPSPPRKSSWKRWTLAVACVVAIALALAALFLKAPTSDPVAVTFLRSTNYNGQKTLVFSLTNGLPRKIGWYARIHTTPPGTNDPSGRLHIYHNPAVGEVEAGRAFTFALDAPPTGTDWRMIWLYVDPGNVPTGREKIRADCSAFLAKLHMRTLARWFEAPPTRHEIGASDFKE